MHPDIMVIWLRHQRTEVNNKVKVKTKHILVYTAVSFRVHSRSPPNPPPPPPPPIPTIWYIKNCLKGSLFVTRYVMDT